MHGSRLICAGLALSLVACTADEPDLPAALRCDPSRPGGYAPTGGVSFDPEEMLCIGIEMDVDDFLALSAEHRLGDSTAEDWDVVWTRLATDCATPFPNRFDWYPADLEIGGRRLERVGVRKKGFFGSVGGAGEYKPSLKIKTDSYVVGQLLDDVTERITLNNNIQDASRMRTCLALEVFHRAGYPAPRCNLANVMVNGEPMGAYVHIESVKVRFLLDTFFDANGSLYEANLADLTVDHLPPAGADHLGRWEAKTDVTVGDDLARLIDTLDATPDDELEPALDRVVNIDNFVTFWALETLVGASDGYTSNRNNVFLYFDDLDIGRATFIPWGLDSTLKDDPTTRDLSGFVRAELPRRFSRIPALATRYEAELGRLLREVWDEEALLASVDRYAEQVRNAQDDDELDGEVEELRAWITTRREAVEAMLAEGLAAGADEPTSCLGNLDDDARDHSRFVVGCSATGVPAWVVVLLALCRRRLR